MIRRRRRRYSKYLQSRYKPNKPLLPPLPPIPTETKKGIIITIIFALAFICFLSLFDLAGAVGIYIKQFLEMSLGWADFIFPLILIVVGYLLLNQEKYQVRGSSFFGLFFLFISFAGLLQSFINFNQEVLIVAGKGGGWLGYAIDLPLKQLIGWWATLIILLAILIISLLLTFNTSIGNLFYLIKKLFNLPKTLFAKKPNTINETLATEEKPEKFEADFTNKKLAEDAKENKDIGSDDDLLLNQNKRKYQKIDIPLDLLDGHSTKPTSGDIKANLEKIQKTLEHFGISVEMSDVNVGPTVTQFTLKPADGVKLSRIVGLQNDLALALAAHPLRIEAPIPGKSLVGIEVPNVSVAIVRLKEILESASFQKRRGDLYFALGKDVSGQAWVANLESMPHLLIAGATGSGKSVCINTLLISLLYQNSPDQLKLILVDPKRVEMTNYNDIPHLLTPVITEIDKTINALRWLVNEMDERYKFLAVHNKRNISVYNQSVLMNKLPYIVIVIDELADLMSVAPREVEGAIIRLAQMARAVGIHLVMATQRPSVNVITGLIKANITNRIAFAVASGIDSRTIIDTSGAEKLLGKGDMLFITPEISKPKRLQGAYVTDKEIERITGFLKEKAQPDYQEAVVSRQSKTPNSLSFNEIGDEDELLSEAKDVILKANKASASLLQRRLRVGYARAARLLDLLEEQGIIGPADGAKPREIMITRDQLADNFEPSNYEEKAGENDQEINDEEDEELNPEDNKN